MMLELGFLRFFGLINSPSTRSVPGQIGEFEQISSFLLLSIMYPSIAELHIGHLVLLKILSASLSSLSENNSSSKSERVFLHC